MVSAQLGYSAVSPSYRSCKYWVTQLQLRNCSYRTRAQTPCLGGLSIVQIPTRCQLHVARGRQQPVSNQSAPRIKGAALKLINRVKRRGTLLFVKFMEICWDRTCWPSIWVRTIKAKGVTVVSIYIDISLGCSINNISGSKYSFWGCTLLNTTGLF